MSRRSATRIRLALSLVITLAVTSNVFPKSQPIYDVIIVGAGLAGVAAALEASAQGAHALLLDMNSMPGGHAIQSSGGVFVVGSDLQRRNGIEDSVEAAFADWMKYGEDGDAAWARRYIEGSVSEVYEWLRKHGVKFTALMHAAADGNRVPRHHLAEGAGRGLMTPLLRELFRRDEIEFRRSVYVEELISRDGRVIGVRGRGARSGKSLEFLGRTVVIATGGFASNLKMVTEQWPGWLPRPRRMLAGSGVNSQGSGHLMAAAMGAELKDLDRLLIYPTGSLNPLHPGEERGIEVISYNLWVDSRGETFNISGRGVNDQVSSALKLVDHFFWSILDSIIKERIFVTGSDWQVNREEKYAALFANQEVVKRGQSLTELARKMGVDAEKLQASVARYNETTMLRLENPPYYAIKHYPLIRKTMGGIRTNLQSQALTKAGEVIEGLYAAGEAAGFGGGNINGKRALEGTFLGPCVLTGRVAGRMAAEEARRLRAAE